MLNNRSYFGYIRVSTPKQGEQGVSLEAQRDAILRCAQRHGIEIVRWFEERETAAKRGRPVFSEMLKLLRSGKAAGVIVHKIDRSARNLWDWAHFGGLIDQGIDVKFANEDLDLRTRGGRLSADIQAVVAADYVRNLREEAKKGLYGRLKQGIYPFAAPLGYLDQGAGKAKILDPVRAPLVRRAFELYGSGTVTLETLSKELERLGFRNRRGRRVAINGLSRILRNPFFIGIIKIKRNGETFRGQHEPLISKTLFDRVQARLDGKIRTRGWKHDFPYRRLFRCKTCGYSLIGETRKGRVYYRCHTQACPVTCLREETIDAAASNVFEPLHFSDSQQHYFRSRLEALRIDWTTERDRARAALKIRLSELSSRLDRLTDAYIDRLLEQDVYLRRKEALLREQRELEEKQIALQRDDASVPDQVAEFLGLASRTSLLFKSATSAQKRTLLEIATSDRIVDQKSITISLVPPFSIVAERRNPLNCGPEGNRIPVSPVRGARIATILQAHRLNFTLLLLGEVEIL